MINLDDPDFTLNPANPTRVNIKPRLEKWDDSPVLTIVTPFYNTGPVFHETAQSILNQTLQQWEWLIINDGSTDQQAIGIIDEYRHKDPRIKVIDHPHNRGLSAARNTGFSHARCEFVLLLDSDDLLEPTAAEKWWWFLETHPQSSFVASYHVAFGGSNYLWTGGFHDGAQNAQRNRVSMMCIVRKSVHKAVGGFDETIRGGLEDWEFWMRCAAHGYWGSTIPEYLAWYRLRADHSDRWENLNKTRQDEFRAVLQRKYPKLYNGGFPILTDFIDYDLTTVDLQVPKFNQIQKTSPHLLLILPWLVMGGSERFSLNLIDQLINRGWTISVLTTSPSENSWLYEFEKRTPFVFMLPNIIPVRDYPRFIGYLIQSRGYDAILLQGSQEGYRLLPTLKMLFPNVPICDYLHFVTPEWMQGGFPRLSLLFQDWIDFTFTSCQQVREWLVQAGADSNRSEVCYIGIDPETWKPDQSRREQVRKELGIDLDEIVILYAARLEEQKQPDIFVDAVNKLSDMGAKFYALVAGEGSLRPKLEEKIKSCALEKRIHLLGSVPAKKMPDVMVASDIFFLPSKNEGISQAFYEAMACELVVVGARVGGQAELVTAECGILLDLANHPDEAVEYAKILHRLIDDSYLRQRLAQASRTRIIEGFTLNLMGRQVHETLGKMIDNKKSTPTRQISAEVKESIYRETQNLVEYLQARRDLRTARQQLSTLVIPQKPSHWFYLWIRQLFLPAYQLVMNSSLGKILQNLQKQIKHVLVKEN